jgi:transposase InsO family protein
VRLAISDDHSGAVQPGDHRLLAQQPADRQKHGDSGSECSITHRRSPQGVMLHSDRGIQYASKSFRKRLKKYRMIQSMSGKGNCYDNAVTETVIKTLKIEWIYGTNHAD